MRKLLKWCATLRYPKEKRRTLRKHAQRVAENDPMSFKVVKSEGVKVGKPLAVIHMTFHDMAPLAILQRMTDEVLLRQLNANALEIIAFGWLDDNNGVTIIQPRRIEESTEGSAAAA